MLPRVALIAWLFLAADISAATLEAPSKVSAGTLVRVKLTSQAQSCKWRVMGPQGAADHQAYEDGRACCFAGSAGSYVVLVDATTPDGKPDRSWCEIVIGDGPAPDPQPEPKPEPKPDPQPAPGEFGKLTDAVKAFASASVFADGELEKVAGIYETVASQCAAGAFQQNTQPGQAVRDKIAQTLAPDRAARWANESRPKIASCLAPYKPDSLTAAQLAAPYEAIAAGLRGAK